MPSAPTDFTRRFTINRHVLTQDLENGIVIVNTAVVTYVELDPVGADIWRALTEEASGNAALDRMQQEYEVPRERLEADFASLIARLIEADVITTDAEAGSVDQEQDSLVTEQQPDPPEAAELYLELLMKTLCGLTQDSYRHLGHRLVGTDVPEAMPGVYTMIGFPRLKNIKALIERALLEQTPGDVIECGVWRGGATIFMRAVLAAHGVTDRRVWVADSFEGLPQVAEDGHPLDTQDWGGLGGRLGVGLADVQEHFRLFGLLDEQVRFLPGWFSDTLPTAPIDQISVLRIDADLYESTRTVLESLYDRVSAGGFVTIDDYFWPSCRAAVTEFLAEHDPHAQITPIDWTGVWWQKTW